MLTVCSWCREYHGRETILADDGLRGDGADGQTLISDGICPVCAREFFPDDADDEDFPEGDERMEQKCHNG